MAFQKLASFTKDVSDLADKPSLTAAQLKAQFDAAPDELRVSFNNLIDALKLTTTGDSGAKNIGATTITGLTGSDVQTILESLKTKIDDQVKKDSICGKSSTITLNPGASYDYTFNYPAGKFTGIPILITDIINTDIDGQYTMAKSIIANQKDAATVRVKNKGNSVQYVFVQWIAQEQ